jgi:ketosteroid isomerase-like protein
MSQANVEVVRAAVAALNAGDTERLSGMFDPDVEFRSAAEQKIYRGVSGLMQYRRDVGATLDDFHTEEDRFLGGDCGPAGQAGDGRRPPAPIRGQRASAKMRLVW